MNRMMKKYNLLWGMIAVLLWCACSDKEDNLEPSHRDRYWMEIQDEPGELNQLRFRLYKEYGIPVFVNDTIGTEQRGYDAYGQPVIYHEMLWPGYTMTYKLSLNFELSSDTVEMIKGVEMIYKWVAPNLFNDIKYRPTSYLLCDRVYAYSANFWSGDSIFETYDIQPSLKTTALSIAGVKDMSQEKLMDFAARIVGKVSYMDIASYYEEELNAFYEISKEGLSTDPYSQKFTYVDTFVFPEGWEEEKLYSTGGFLHDRSRQRSWTSSSKEIYAYTASPDTDVEDYVGAVMVYSEAEFEEQYGQYDKMMRKFRFMRDIVDRFKKNVLKQ
jgi:lipoprotein